MLFLDLQTHGVNITGQVLPTCVWCTMREHHTTQASLQPSPDTDSVQCLCVGAVVLSLVQWVHLKMLLLEFMLTVL